MNAMQSRRLLLLAAAFLFAVFCLHSRQAFAADSLMVVHTTTGQLRGVARPGGGAEFLGIPYAEPPLAALRWHAPVPLKPWQGVRDASAFGSPCSQPDLGDWNRIAAETGKEDCLFLNVIVPSWPVTRPLPVMFWIHGGANEGGSASSALYKDGTLVNHGVLLVTVNYRLGIFGFFAHPELTRESSHGSSGNYGLMDQILALRWVRDNIANFGGDPNNITVFGQSAGAMDTSMLMAAPEAMPLFHKAILESGAAFSAPIPPLAYAERSGSQLAQALKAPADGAVKFLRGIPAKDLLAALATLDRKAFPRIGPDIDGWVLPRQPAEVFASGRESAIPLLYGVTTREFGGNASPDELRVTIRTAAGTFADKALAAYGLSGASAPPSDSKYGTASDQWSADIIFRCPAVIQGAWHRAAHNPTYQYEFNHAIPGQPAAVHSTDLAYVFGYYPKTGNLAGPMSEVDFKLADLVETYFTNFAKSGDPNAAGLPNWPQLDDSGAYIQFQQDGTIHTAAGLRKAQCDVYHQWLTDRLGSARTEAASR